MITRTTIITCAVAGALIAQEPAPAPTPETVKVTSQGVIVQDAAAQTAQVPVVELAICLDTSGSMDGLIEAAKQRIWAVVNDLALAEPTPHLRVALLTYGNDGHEESDGWVRVHTGFTEDLDRVSQELFSFTTNGGTELVGRVMSASLDKLDWSDSPQALKLMVVAGNESADQDREVDFRAMCSAAISHGIMVSSIYCGGIGDAEAPGWQEVATLSDGHFAVLDHQSAPLAVATPFDVRLSELSTSVNGTYLPYGELGKVACENQWAQDRNAASLNGSAVAQRAATKGGALYRNEHWDLVDACKQKEFKLEEVKVEDLPEAMQEMTPEQRVAHIATMSTERDKLQAVIGDLAKQRDAFVIEVRRQSGLDSTDAFDRAIRDAMRARAGSKGLRFPQPEPVAEPTMEEVSETPAEEVANAG